MKFLKYLLLAFALMVGGKTMQAQIGPLPCGAISNLTTFRMAVPYKIGDIVILNGQSFQSSQNSNLGNNPCTSPSWWSTTIGTGPTGPAGATGPTGPQGNPGAPGAGLPVPPAPGYAPLSTGTTVDSYVATAVATQVYTTARQTYVLEDYLSTADGHTGTDYGYAATNFCASVGCSTLTMPIGLKTTHNGTCAVYTSITIPTPIVFDGSSCVFVPQSSMANAPIALTACSTTMGSTAVTCANTTGLAAGMAVGGDPTIGPENYIASVTNGTTFQLVLPASRNFLGIPTNGTAAIKGIDSMIDAVAGQTITGTGVSGTISSISYANNTWTMSANSTVGTLSPVDLQLASGTVVSSLSLTAVAQTPVILVPPSNTATSQARPHGPNYGVSLVHVTIRDPAYSHSNFGRTITGLVGIKAYGQDNLYLHDITVDGIKGSALVYGGYVPSSTADGSNVVRESEVDDFFAYSDGDITTGQACLALMTGIGNADTNQDEINQDGFHNFHCVYPDAEGLVIGSYLHPGTTNGPRLLTFGNDNQFEAGSNASFSFGATDMVRILAAGGYNKFLGGRWDTPGYGHSTFRISNAIDFAITGAEIGASGGSSEVYNVGLTASSPTVSYTSAGTGGGTSFVTGPYWNGIGAQLNDSSGCTPCNVWLSPTGAVNGAGTVLTLASNYTGSQTTGTLTLQGGGYYFHLDTAVAPLNAIGNSYIDQASPIISLLALTSATNGFLVGTGALVSPPAGLTDHLQSWSLNNLIMPPTNYTANSSSRSINFDPAYLNSLGVFQLGQVAQFASVGAGTNPSVNINAVCAVCGGDFHYTFQNNTTGGGSFMDLVAGAASQQAYISMNGNAIGWQAGIKGSTLWQLFDKTNNTISFTVTPVTEAVAFTGPVAAPSFNGNQMYFGVDSGAANAYVVTTTPAVPALVAGVQIWFVPLNNGTTAAPTVNVSGLGVKTITQLGNNALQGTPIQTAIPVLIVYNGTNWILVNSGQPNAYYGHGVLFPAAPTTGCVLNAQNTTAYQCTGTLPLTGTTASIGGSSLAAGACSTGTATVTGATASMAVSVSPAADPQGGTTTNGVSVYGYVSATNTVTVRVCALVAFTPTSTTYNVRVNQ